MVVGCLEGECHYLMGNIRARKRVNKVKKDLVPMGLEPERLEMFNLSSSEGPKFAAYAREMVARTLKLGPSPMKREERAAWLAEPTQSRRRVKIREGLGEGAKGGSPFAYEKLPQTPSPNPISKGDPPGRP